MCLLPVAGNVWSGLLSLPITLFAGGIGGFIWWLYDGSYWGLRSKVNAMLLFATCQVSALPLRLC